MARKNFLRSKRPVIAYVINNASNWKTYIIPVLIYNVSMVGRIPLTVNDGVPSSDQNNRKNQMYTTLVQTYLFVNKICMRHQARYEHI